MNIHDFLLGIASGVFICACLFRYTYWRIERKEEAIEFLRQRIAFTARGRRLPLFPGRRLKP